MLLNITEEHASQRLSCLDLNFQYSTFCKDAIGVVRISFCRTRSAVLTTMKMSFDTIKPALSLRRVRRAAVLSLRSHCEALVATADRHGWLVGFLTSSSTTRLYRGRGRHVLHCKLDISFSTNKSRNVKEHIIMEELGCAINLRYCVQSPRCFSLPCLWSQLLLSLQAQWSNLLLALDNLLSQMV